jgi:hypothetical protein
MSTPAITTPARTLLGLLRNDPGQPAPTDATADMVMSDFLADITMLDGRHNRGKRITQDQLAEQVFRRSPTFKDRKASIPYLRYQLRVALEELTTLDREMRKQNGGSITFETLSRYRPIIQDYLFDLREILVFLQQNVPGWTFFEGGKNSGVSSWEVYLLARGLAYQSTYAETGLPLDHKAAQIASIFVLRQAMELRFERLIAVYPTDPKGKPPKLKHGFHQDFIVANPQFFLADGFKVKELRHLYDWCSEIVHQAYQPYTWQISMALRRGGDLLHTRRAPKNEPWSIYNAVEVPNVEAMQAAYENHFLATYGHGAWRFTREQPEALIRNWRSDMAFTSDDYRPALNRPDLCARVKSRAKRFLRR